MDAAQCRVTIIGLGLIGGSFALGLSGKVREVRGADADPEVIRLARKRQMADVLDTDARRLLPGSDLVVVALYPEQTERFILEHQDRFDPGTLVIDVSSIKEGIVERVQGALGDRVEFLGTHPMAGREGRGITRAREEMFLGSYYLLTPTEKNREASLARVSELVGLLGVRQVVRLDPAEHDRLVAYTSQMPHVLASVLMNGFRDEARWLVGGSFKDATRVASINADLWVELFLHNRTHLLREMDAFSERLDIFREALQNSDEEALRALLHQADEHKKEIK